MACGNSSRRVSAKVDIACAIHFQSRLDASNSARSKLLATWMSMEGLSVWRAAPDS
jgi:hypothetical protein